MAYLVCDKCGGYYELQPNESPEDFTDKCECGGNLKYVQDLNDVDDLQKVCPNCGSVVDDKDVVCPVCDFELKEPPVTDKQFVFGSLWYVQRVGFLTIGLIVCIWAFWVTVPFLFQAKSAEDFNSALWMFLSVLFLTIFIIAIILFKIRRFHVGYLKGYLEWHKKLNWNWNAIGAAFVITMVIGIFGGKHLPNNVGLIGPLIGGFVAGCIVGKNYTNGLIYGGFPAGIAGFIGFPLLILLFGSEIPSFSNTSLGILLIVALVLAVTYFIVFFIIGSIGGIIGTTLKKISS